jgi:CheY-like chemotaxis protein
MNETCILIVEDEPSISEVVGLYLRRAGFQVHTVSDGNSALSFLEKQLPDLVVLDVMLPGIDGLSVLRWLRDQSDTPVILVTARREEVDRIAGWRWEPTITSLNPSVPRSWSAVLGLSLGARKLAIPEAMDHLLLEI